MSSGDFSSVVTAQSDRYAAYPEYAKQLDPRYISTKSTRAYAIIAVNDVYFPFEHAYPWLRERTGNNVFVVENANHDAPHTDVDAIVMKFIQSVQDDKKISTNINNTDIPNVKMNNYDIKIEWKNVDVKTILYSLGDKIMYSYFFNVNPFYKLKPDNKSNVMLLIQGVRNDTKLPVSYFMNNIKQIVPLFF